MRCCHVVQYVGGVRWARKRTCRGHISHQTLHSKCKAGSRCCLRATGCEKPLETTEVLL
jgi:hypothetical protein